MPSNYLLCCCKPRAKQRNQLDMLPASDNGAIGLAHIVTALDPALEANSSIGAAELAIQTPKIQMNDLHFANQETKQLFFAAEEDPIDICSHSQNLWARARNLEEEYILGASVLHENPNTSMLRLLPGVNSVSRQVAQECIGRGHPAPVCLIVGQCGNMELFLDYCSEPNYDELRILTCNGTKAYIMENHERTIQRLTYEDPNTLLFCSPKRFLLYRKELWREDQWTVKNEGGAEA